MEITLFDLASRFVGMKEVAGAKNHPYIVWAHSLTGLNDAPDEIAWCSSWLYSFAWLLDLDRPVHTTNSHPARARSWLTCGKVITLAQASIDFDVVIFKTGGGEQPGPEIIMAPGHVAIYAGIGENGHVRCLGGNQRDSVNITQFPAEQLLGVRRLLG